MDLFAAIAVIVSVIGFFLILAGVFLLYKYQAYKIQRQQSCVEKAPPPMRKLRVQRGRVVSAAETLMPSNQSPSPLGWSSMRGSRRLMTPSGGYPSHIEENEKVNAIDLAEKGIRLPRKSSLKRVPMPAEQAIAASFDSSLSPTMMNRPRKPPRIHTPVRNSPDYWPLPHSSYSAINRASPILEVHEDGSEAPSLVEDKSPDMATPRTGSMPRGPIGSWYFKAQNQISMYGSSSTPDIEKHYHDTSFVDTGVTAEMGTAAVISIARAHMADQSSSDHIRNSFKGSEFSINSNDSPVSPMSTGQHSEFHIVVSPPERTSSGQRRFSTPIPEVSSVHSNVSSQNESEYRSSDTDREFSTPTEYPRSDKFMALLPEPEIAFQNEYHSDQQANAQPVLERDVTRLDKQSREESKTDDSSGGTSNKVFNTQRLGLHDLHRVFNLPIERLPA